MKEIIALKQFYQLEKSKARYVLFRGSTRCLSQGTEIRMGDGTTKKIEDIVVGDYISTLEGPQKVLDTHSGECEMYNIHQNKGEDYIVTEDHLLSLRQTRKTKYNIYGDEMRRLYPENKYRKKVLYTDNYDKEKIYDFTAKEWSEFSKKKQLQYSGFKNTLIELQKIENEIDPYYLGLWLGDGNSNQGHIITTADKEIIDYLYEVSNEFNLKVVNHQNYSYSLRHKEFNHQSDFSKKFYRLNLIKNKHIPKNYIYTCYEDRLKLIAGLIDSDGHATKRNTLTITQKRKNIIEELQEILQISGFYTNGITSKISKMKRLDGSTYECKVYMLEINHPDFIDLNKYIKIERKRIIKLLDKPQYMFNTNIISTPIGKGIYYGFRLENCPYFRLKDGTITHNSGKTISIIQWLLTQMTKHKINIVIGVQTLKKGKKNLIPDIMEWLRHLNLDFEYNKSDFIFTNTKNGSTMSMLNCDDESKWFGLKADIFWYNEATSIDKSIFDQSQMRLPDRKDFLNRIILDFNPTSPYSWCRELENSELPGGVETYVSTYNDNPFLGEKQKQTIEDFKLTNYNKWLVFARGEYGEVRGAIYTNWTTTDLMPSVEKYWYGLDFGFTNDPTSLVKCCMQNGELFVEELIYERGLTNQDISEKLNELKLRGVEIVADSSEPKSIEEIRRLGFNIKGVKKFPNSIQTGIDVLQRYKINILKSSKNLQDEIINYTWKENRSSGEFSNEPSGGWDHGLDGLRYIAMDYLMAPKKQMIIR